MQTSSTTLSVAHPERTRARAVELGLLEPDRSREVLQAYDQAAPSISFSSWLVEKGHLSVDQVARLEVEGAAPVDLPPIEPGDRFSGCVIDRLLGQGGMGIVYLARREADDREVVVKFLAPAHTRNQMWRARFLREGLAVRRVRHPNVLEVYGVEVEGPRPHIVMEFVPGADLEEVLAERTQLPPDEVARIGRDMASGLAAAHAQGVIHRDIKPGNVRLDPQGCVKLLDFGLAKDIEGEEGITVAGQILGTPHYMAPEQWGDHEVDARCDIYSLGATLYHLATGQVPCPGKTAVAVCRKILKAKYERPRVLAPDVPQDLELAILRMMSLQRRCRYATATECAEDLQRVLDKARVDVPCIIDRGSNVRYPLLPATSFTIGRDPECDIVLPYASVSRHHARIDLEETGFVLHDLLSSYGTWVNGMRVTRILLKPGDDLRFSDVPFEFRDGGLSATMNASSSLDEDRVHVRPVPQPVWRTLVEQRDPRVVVGLIEQLPNETIDATVASARTALRRLLGGEIAEKAGSGFERRLRERRIEAADALFEITKENLRTDLKAWLAWWDQARGRYPPQLGPYHPRPIVRLKYFDGGRTHTLQLDDRTEWLVGRSTECPVKLANPSVSRRHATIICLHQRYMVRDEGSRFGTQVNGQTVRTAFLEPGDRIKLSEVEMLFESEDLIAHPPQTSDGMTLVDTLLFDALLELEHPSVVTALTRFLVAEQGLTWIEGCAVRLAKGGEDTRRFSEAVLEAYQAESQRARRLLPKLVPALAGLPTDDGWQSWAQCLRATTDLPAQVLPEAWFPKRARPSRKPEPAL